MSCRYRAVLFDMDGTLLDSYEAIGEAARITIQRYGLTLPEGIPLSWFIGPPPEQTFGRWFRWEDEARLKEVIAFYRALYEERMFMGRVYPGIFPLLEALRGAGVRTSLATMKRQPGALELARRFGFAQRLDWIQGRDPAAGIATKADVVRAAMAQLGVEDPRQVVLVGDSNLDLTGARESGVDFAAVYYGFGFSHHPGREAEPSGCTVQLDTVEELTAFLLSACSASPGAPN
ncbi:MAG: HAD hydrolase-like protein [Angelakisella sp.]|nr:HAD hydrolase-like protein [Angelakisella sp.]